MRLQLWGVSSSTERQGCSVSGVKDTAALVLELSHDPILANRLLFAKRHPKESAPFHPRMIAALTSRVPQVLVKAFRGSAKSTTAEEVMTQGGVFQDFQYGLIVGSTYDRACDRLKTIKHELDFNEKLLTMFGTLQGSSGGVDTIILSSGVMLKADWARAVGSRLEGSVPEQPA